MYLRSKTQGRLRCQKRRSLPQPVKKPQNHFHEYRQKVTVTTLFQTAFNRVFQLLAQTAHVRFHEQKRTHSPSPTGSHTAAYTPKQGAFRMGGYHYSRSVPHVHQHPRAGYQNGKFCRFWGLVGGAPKERRKPRDSDALMRVAAPRRRGPAGLRDPVSALLIMW